jgi:hypothetical protein
MDTKVCSKCDIEKKFEDFYKKPGCLFGLNSYCKKCHLEIKQNYRKNNPEKYKKETKKYYEQTKEIQKQKKKKWIEKNREKYNSYWTNRKKKEPEFKLLMTMRSRLSSYLKTHNITKKNKTFEIVGCSPTQLKEHLEKQFKNGMNWENRNLWHIDHIIPLASANTEEELYKLCHFTNLQPLWAEENIKKSDKLLTY